MCAAWLVGGRSLLFSASSSVVVLFSVPGSRPEAFVISIFDGSRAPVCRTVLTVCPISLVFISHDSHIYTFQRGILAHPRVRPKCNPVTTSVGRGRKRSVCTTQRASVRCPCTVTTPRCKKDNRRCTGISSLSGGTVTTRGPAVFYVHRV